MTHPISNERVKWLEARFKVVQECIRIAQTQMYALQSGGGHREDLQRALVQFNTEQTTIMIELKVLKGMDVHP